jgi:hypothetical protein
VLPIGNGGNGTTCGRKDEIAAALQRGTAFDLKHETAYIPLLERDSAQYRPRWSHSIGAGDHNPPCNGKS